MVRHTPEKYLQGLESIRLTNAASLSRRDRRGKTKWKGKKVKLADCRGWCSYDPSRIVLIINNIYGPEPKWYLSIGFLSDFLLGEVFFHELGHHIHKTQSPKYGERENIADKWEKWLKWRYLGRRYWYILLPLKPFKPVVRWVIRLLGAQRSKRH